MKIKWIRLLEIAFLLWFFHYLMGLYSNIMYTLEEYNISLILTFVFITDISASLFSQNSLSSSYLSNPKTRVFYISCGLLLSIPTAYALILWDITGRLGDNTVMLFWECLLPTNIITLISMFLAFLLIYFNNPNRSKKHFIPMILGIIVSEVWLAIIYQKCMDGSILFNYNTLDLLTYFFYIGTAIAVVLLMGVATLYLSLHKPRLKAQ